MRPSFLKIGIGLTIIGIVWLSFIFNEGDKIWEEFSLTSKDSFEIQMNFEESDIGYYKIFMPDFSGKGVFIQVLDQNRNVISDNIVETKLSVGYFDFEEGLHVLKISNLSEDKMDLEVEFGTTNGKEMVIPGIVTLIGGLMIVFASYIKLRDYRIAQPDENIS